MVLGVDESGGDRYLCEDILVDIVFVVVYKKCWYEVGVFLV